MIDDQLFKRAHDRADIKAVAGVELYRAGKRWRGECPLCGSGKGKKSGGPFSVDIVKKMFKCWACGEASDVIGLESLITGKSRMDCAKALAGEFELGTAYVPTTAAANVHVPEDDFMPGEEGPTFAQKFAARIWAEAVPARGTLVQRYLMSRGITGWVLLTMVEQLRFHPNVYHSNHDGRSLSFPAMVARVVVPIATGCQANPTGGIHCTYLARDGSGKAPVPKDRNAKQMWGPQGLDGRPGGAWLSNIDAAGDLLVAEGIETVASMAMLHGEPCRMVAALSLDRLQGGWMTDAWGRSDPDVPVADPDKPAFTWRSPPEAPWRRVFIGLDMDMSPIRVKVRASLKGGTIDRMIDGVARARRCGSLARQHWQRAGAIDARSVAPGIGEDFNDKLRRVIAAGELR
jgi:hypothetical protein